jgi:hypothetical protein
MTAASVASAEEICISRLDNVRGQCYDRTNVRRMRGSRNMSRVEEKRTAYQQMVEILLHASEDEAKEILKEVTAFRESASAR